MLTQQEQLYLKTLDDLNYRIISHDPYQILGLSALIRKLFLDDHPLVDQVNQEHKLKFIFNVCLPNQNIFGLPGMEVYTIQDGLDPDTSIRPGKPTTQLGRDQFFKTIVLVINGKNYTIKEVVLFEANIMGGVHAGAPKLEKDKIMKTLNDQLSVGGYPSSLRQLKAIARVVKKALAPLTEHVKSKLK
ncbi:MAG: hypothetical protein ACLQUW_12690 [Desulfobaccales bacterium]